MTTCPFYIVDVFTDKPYSGNQLAVIGDAGGLSDNTMQAIAREMNYSETTFIQTELPHHDAWPVRIFTPTEEIPFAGHPTLGTAFVIQQELINAQVSLIKLTLGVGEIPVTFDYASGRPCRLTMTQNPPRFGRVYDPAILASLLGLTVDDIDTAYPCETATTGLASVMIPLKSLEAVRRTVVDRGKYAEFIQHADAKIILVFSRETIEPDHDIHVRAFPIYYGVDEDPATGSAAGALAGYLVKNRFFDVDNITIRAEQGYEIRRPSVLHLDADRCGNEISVQVGGEVVMTARGNLC